MANELDLSYPNIRQHFGKHLIDGRVESRALLGWFLEHYYRMEETDAQDAICDGPDDKGIDGIYIDGNLEHIVVFQAKLRQNTDKALGDTELKEFAGTLAQLANRANAEELARTTRNIELQRLLHDNDIPGKIEAGYQVRGVFVTNANADPVAHQFAEKADVITVFDGEALKANWVPDGDVAPVSQEVTFHLDGLGAMRHPTPDATVYLALLRASELVAMSGIQSGELFVWNVRQTLGRTKVNKAIADSVINQAEHRNFAMYHNGLTVLAQSVEQEADTIKINGYTVVNGCQSLSTLYANRAKISDDLRLLTRIVQLDPASELAAKITRHSNNQNAINARDLQSNSTIQRRLQTEFQKEFKDAIGYEIKRGETVQAKVVIPNELAARQLLAFDNQLPWNCHQTYKLFDELHGEIFGRVEVDAVRIALVNVLYEAVLESTPKIANKLFANYTLTRYFLLYLLRRAIDCDAPGKAFVKNPTSAWRKFGFDKIKEVALRVLADLIVDINGELDDRQAKNQAFDYKKDLKSPNAVRQLAMDILSPYEKQIQRNRISSFASELGLP